MCPPAGAAVVPARRAGAERSLCAAAPGGHPRDEQAHARRQTQHPQIRLCCAAGLAAHTHDKRILTYAGVC